MADPAENMAELIFKKDVAGLCVCVRTGNTAAHVRETCVHVRTPTATRAPTTSLLVQLC